MSATNQAMAQASSGTAQGTEPEQEQNFNFSDYLQGKRSKNRKTMAIVSALLIIFGTFILFKIYESSIVPEIESSPLELRLYTHNIRNDNPYPDKGEHPWTERRNLVASSIRFHTENTGSSVVGLQEVLYNQLEDVLNILNYENEKGDWTYYGIGREDGKKKGEFAPILYKQSEWSIIGNRTFWLSETPDVPSIGWDSALERIVTMVTLKSKNSQGTIVNVFNTHFDHIGVVGRKNSAKLIVDRMENYNNYPSFLLGDFNTLPTDEPYQVLKKHGIKDSRTLATKEQSYGHSSTFTGFDIDDEKSGIIDYIWAPSYSTNNRTIDTPKNKTTDISIKSFGVLHSHFGFHSSDHRPVVALYELNRF
ncbi:hypothetical protein CAAN1_31S00958 [[Candida] anglica]|uniref:Endonuclease/exonuclease/phosphatase domain-containing protein n=1 Tax=[Candida] anglica TaxID=148631 RepID=A0ABP0EJ02_9ASCO